MDRKWIENGQKIDRKWKVNKQIKTRWKMKMDRK